MNKRTRIFSVVVALALGASLAAAGGAAGATVANMSGGYQYTPTGPAGVTLDVSEGTYQYSIAMVTGEIPVFVFQSSEPIPGFPSLTYTPNGGITEDDFSGCASQDGELKCVRQPGTITATGTSAGDDLAIDSSGSPSGSGCHCGGMLDRPFRASGLGSSDNLTGGLRADVLTGGPGGDTFTALDDADQVFSADGLAENVDCGPGADKAVADAFDPTTSCEVILTDADLDGVTDDLDACPQQPAMTSDGCPPKAIPVTTAIATAPATGQRAAALKKCKKKKGAAKKRCKKKALLLPV